MKKSIAILILTALLTMPLAGCMSRTPQETNGTQPSQNPTTVTDPSQDTNQGDTTAKTESAMILANIWEAYGENERFAVYGGAVDNSVNDAPGDLDITNTDELTTRYLLPKEHLSSIQEAASMVHLMNNNIFTAVVLRLDESVTPQTVAKALRDNVQNNQWICGQPDKLLMAQLNGTHLLMVFGSADTVDLFRSKLSGVYADATILYDENIVA